MRPTPTIIAIATVCLVFLGIALSLIAWIATGFENASALVAAVTLLGCVGLYLLLGLLGMVWRTDTSKAAATVAAALAFTLGLQQMMTPRERATTAAARTMDLSAASVVAGTRFVLLDDASGCGADQASTDARPVHAALFVGEPSSLACPGTSELADRSNP